MLLWNQGSLWLEPLRGPNGLDLSRLKRHTTLAGTRLLIYDSCSFRFFKFARVEATEINAAQLCHLWHAEWLASNAKTHLKKELT
ncbi:hypothetical protein H5410_052510 [Solanum commersonii]|uniref:Uncharacterized protein n=1 Tax=Solanum commersonii TaxID=4109 RepID=A0A9J5X1A4_SOLCO|nr:hypothetical protein H5410_052510 [Solanum commersonii]